MVAALAWQVVAGIKELLHDWSVPLTPTRLLIDNSAALSIIDIGSNWRTRYFGVRATRIREE
eukprot:1650332-Prorocentrum_lima.AAC.1